MKPTSLTIPRPRHRLALALLGAVILALCSGGLVWAAPPLPYSPWGIVRIGGVAAPAGIQVSARIDGVEYGAAETVTGGWYALDVSGDDVGSPEKDGGTAGETVTFVVGSATAAQTGIWISGSAARLDLDVEGEAPTPAPTSTHTPTPIPTTTSTNTLAATATRTPTHSLTPTATPTGEPPGTATYTATPTATGMPAWTPTLTATPTPTNTTSSPTATQMATGDPSETATPTATRDYSNAIFLGRVTIQGRPAPPHPSWVMSLEIKLGGQGYGSRQTVTDEYGRFTLELPPWATYDLGVKGSTTLRNVRTRLVSVPGEQSVDFGVLLTGDASGDNAVDIVDFSIFRTEYGGAGSRADFNGDGSVDIVDFSLLRTNFGRAGEVLASPPR